MRKLLFATLLLFLAFGQMWGGTRRIYFDFSAVTMWDDDTELAGGTGYVGVHCWGSGTLSDTDYHMSATGTANLAYADIDDSFTSVCFFRAASNNTWWNQTQDRSDITTNNRFKIKNVKGEHGGDKDKYLWADSDAGIRWAPGSTIDGLIDVNNPHNQAFSFSGSTGTYSVTLSAHSTYQFKILEGTTAYGLDNNVFTGPISNYASSSSGYAYRLATAGAGVYTFTWDNSTKKLSISFPSVTHPSADYCYLYDHRWGYEKQFVHVWNSESEIAQTTWPGTKVPNTTTINGSTFFICAPGDYANLQFSNGISGEGAYATTDLTASAGYGKYMYHDGSSWGWHTFSFNVEEHNNGGRIWSDSIGSYNFGEGATLPTNITKWEYDFAGWYDNAELNGEPVTTIADDATGNKDYYAKWTSIAQTYPIASHSEFLAAQEGDIIAITVTGVHTSAAIYLKDANNTDIANLSISATGTYTFPLSAASATGIRTYGLQVTGQNFTFSDVDIRYRKEIWSGTLSDNTGWAEVAVDKSIFSGMSGGDFLGFYISAINTGSYHQYSMRADYDEVFSGTRAETGIAIKQLTADHITALTDSNRIDITAQYLDVSNLYSYTNTRVYSVTFNTNSGTINAGNVTSYTFGTGATLPTDVTRTGYTFAGWYPDAEFAGDRVYSISTTDYGDKTYYAKWTVNTYDVTLHTNDGKINSGNVTTYTFGTGATLPTDVTLWGYTFDGWYDNEELTGSAVTEIAGDATGNKTYWAKWTSISETMLSGSHPEFLAAEEGDILVITVSDVQPSAQIVLKNTSSEEINSKSISATGKHAFQLTAEGATALQTGVIITGKNYTKSSVALLYKKTIWNEGVADKSGWTYKTISDRSGFTGIADGDYLGFSVSDLYEPETNTNQYFMQYDYKEFITSAGIDETGTYLEVVPSDGADKLKTGDKDLTIGAKNLTLSELNRYLTTRDYTVTLHTNYGTINSGDVTSYTYGVGATLPTNVTLDGYNFDGWYDNAELSGDAVTTITTSDYGNKTYWAKWTSISETLLAAEHPEFLAAEEGDILVITVSDVQPSAQIFLANTSSVEIDSKSITTTGKYMFRLSASAATALHTGVIITGVNYTKSSVALLYKNDIWTGSLESPIENVVWRSQSIASSKFAGIEDGDYVSFTISSIAEDSSWCQYNLCSGTGGVLTYSAKSSGAGTYIHEIPSGKATELQADGDYIAAQNLTISAFSRYLTTRVYTVTLKTNNGTINAGNVTSYTYPVGATLPTNVTRDGYRFDGWYPDAEFAGDRVYTISTTDYGAKTYYAKWTSIAQIVSSATDNSLKIASEGDLLLINVATVGESAQIMVKNYAGDTDLFTKAISATGKYAFPLSSTDATALRTGLTITGTNYTYTYQLLYRKTIWHDVLESPKDEVEWQTASLTHADMAGIADGDYVGFTVSAINTDKFHQYNLCAYKDPTTYVAANNTTNDAGTYIETIKSGFATHLIDEDKSVFIAAQNLTLTDFYRYLPTRDYTLTLDDQFASTAFYVAGEGSRTVTYVANTNLTTTFTRPQREGYTFGGYYTAKDGDGTQIIDANGDVVAGASDATYTYTDASRNWNYPGSLTVYAKWTDDGFYYFYGGESGTGSAWATAANWTKGAAPSENTHDVTLLKPATLSTGTTKLASVTIVPGDGDSYTPTGGSAITPSGALTIPPTGALVVNTIAGATANTLLIESSASGTGALVAASESHTTAATVQFYTKAKNDVGGSGYINQYFGTPVDSVVKNPTFYGAYLRKFDVATDAWASFSDSKMYGFTAYRIMRAETSEGTYSVKGNLILPGITTHKDTVLRLTNTAKKDNMFANSWTAPINIAKMDATDFVGAIATIYVFNAGSSTDGSNTDKYSGAGAGNWSATPVEALKSAIAANPDQTTYEMTQIPSQQAFLVQTDGDGGTYTLTLDYKKLVYNPIAENGATITPTRAPKRTLDAEVDLMQLNLSAESGLRDRVLLYVSDDFSADELDNGWEAYKLSGEAFAPQLCANTPLGEMAISATKDIEGTVLGFYAGTQDDHYTFSFDYNGEGNWYLNDLDENRSTLIDSANEYQFTATKGTVAANRFTVSRSPISKTPTGIDDVNDRANACKRMMNGTLYIIRDGRIYNAEGALVK